MVSRRHLIAAFGAAALAPLLPGAAFAGVARGLRLPELVRRSPSILRGMPLDAYSEWLRLGDERRIVTYTRVRVDDALAGGGYEVMVRTLGGTVGKIGQVVADEAQLLLGEACVAFLMPVDRDILGVTGMAQGHYPLRADSSGTLRLNASAQLSFLLDDKESAVSRLSGRSVSEVRDLVRQAAAR
jgi:hypothetical protein